MDTNLKILRGFVMSDSFARVAGKSPAEIIETLLLAIDSLEDNAKELHDVRRAIVDMPHKCTREGRKECKRLEAVYNALVLK